MTILISAFFWWNLWNNRNAQAIPNPDIFQYIGDGYRYINFKLPDSIHPPPLAPIMITSLAKILSSFVIYPEIAAVKLINITLSSLTLVAIYILVSPIISPLFSFLLVLLVATNQINLLYSVDVTNEIIYSFFLTLSLILYYYRKKPYVYLLFGLLFLLRYESVVIPISVFIIEHYSKRPSLKLKNILFSFIPIFLWLIVLNFHSRIGNSILGNAYIEEIFNGLKKLPNLLNYYSLIDLITFESSYPLQNQNQFFSFVVLCLSTYGIINQKSKPIQKIIYLAFFLHQLFLFAFPNFAIRYNTPMIWILYLILSNHKSKYISFAVLVCLLGYNIARIDVPSSYSHPNDMKEYRLVADWLNKTKFQKPTTVLIYEPHILRYYVIKKEVYVPYDSETPFQKCKEDIICICESLLNKNHTDTNIYVITSAYSTNDYSFSHDKFTPILHHIGVFNDKIYQKNPDFTFVTQIMSDDGNNWANVWQYIPAK